MSAFADKQHRTIVGIVVGIVLFLLALAVVVAWREGLLVPPDWVVWHEETFEADFDGDGASEGNVADGNDSASSGAPEQLRLAGRRATLFSAEGATLWQSDPSWLVADALACDITTDDSTPELVMLVWRRGNYGSSHPFWESGLDLHWRLHVYIMHLDGEKLRPVWMGHGLDEEVVSLASSAPGTLALIDRDGTTVTWRWRQGGFGFYID
jgi:hypothetical protein